MKSRKLKCNITGKVLTAAKEYYQKKVEKAGSEEKLHSTYICKDAKKLLKKGHSIAEIQTALKVVDFNATITDEEAKNLIITPSLRVNISEQPTIGVIKTDPDVKKFIENILNDK